MQLYIYLYPEIGLTMYNVISEKTNYTRQHEKLLRIILHSTVMFQYLNFSIKVQKFCQVVDNSNNVDMKMVDKMR